MPEEKKIKIKKEEKQEIKKSAIKRKFNGVVISNKMNKTIVVKVERVKVHPRYGKRYKVSQKYKAHDEQGKFLIGDKVAIVECRPISKDKRFRVLYN